VGRKRPQGFQEGLLGRAQLQGEILFFPQQGYCPHALISADLNDPAAVVGFDRAAADRLEGIGHPNGPLAAAIVDVRARGDEPALDLELVGPSHLQHLSDSIGIGQRAEALLPATR